MEVTDDIFEEYPYVITFNLVIMKWALQMKK